MRWQELVYDSDAAVNRIRLQQIEELVRQNMREQKIKAIEDAYDPRLSPLENMLFNDPEKLLRMGTKSTKETDRPNRWHYN
jgi:hypothetical protein